MHIITLQYHVLEYYDKLCNPNRLVGPKGARIIISCLPLFTLPGGGEGAADTNSPPTLGKQELDKSLSLKSNKGFEASQTGWIQFTTSVNNGGINDASVSDILEPLPRLDDVFNSSTGNNAFTYLDPFSSNEGSESLNFEESTRDKAFSEVFAKATGENKDGGKEGCVEDGEDKSGRNKETNREAGSSGKDFSDSDDNYINDDGPFSVEYVDTLPKNRAASISFVKYSEITESTSVSSSRRPSLTSTKLPPPPPVSVIPQYETKGGWLIKLSHRKGNSVQVCL